MKDFYFLENSQKFMKHGEYSNLYIGGQVILDSPEKKNNDDHDVTYQFRLVDFFILDNNNKLTKHDLGDGYKYIQDKKFVEIGLILKEEATPIEATQTKYFLNKVTEWRRSYVR